MKCSSDGKSLETLSPIWQARDLNLRLPAQEPNALPLDQLDSMFAFNNLYQVVQSYVNDNVQHSNE